MATPSKLEDNGRYALNWLVSARRDYVYRDIEEKKERKGYLTSAIEGVIVGFIAICGVLLQQRFFPEKTFLLWIAGFVLLGATGMMLLFLVFFIIYSSIAIYYRREWNRVWKLYKHTIPKSLPLEEFLDLYSKTKESADTISDSELKIRTEERIDRTGSSEPPFWIHMIEQEKKLTSIANRTIGTYGDVVENHTEKLGFLKEAIQGIEELATRTIMVFMKAIKLQDTIKNYGVDSEEGIRPKDKENYDSDVKTHQHWLDTMESSTQELNTLRLQLESSIARQDAPDLEEALRNARSISETLQEIIDLDDPKAAFDRKLAKA